MSTLHTERQTPPRAYDDPDEEDYPMPHRYEAANHSGSDREISLGTGTILAIFFLLALVCSVFFGFGYTMGHKSNPLSTMAASASPDRGLADAFKSFKPAPGGGAQTSASPARTPAARDAEPTTPLSTAVVVPSSPRPTAPANVAAKKPFDPDAEIVTSVNPASAAKPPTAPHSGSAVRASQADSEIANTTPSRAGTAIVQVAAVSHQEDADTVIAALNRKGYTVAAHHEPQDKLLHIQLGPYPSKKDAEAMQKRLQSDGYNAILK